MEKRDKVCVLVSGGVDSAALVARFLDLEKTVYPVYVMSGYYWERAELHWLRRLLASGALRRHGGSLKPLACLRVPAREFLSESHWALCGRNAPVAGSRWTAVYLPGRNLMLLTAASVFCARRSIGTLALGTLLGNPFSDATPSFFSKFEKASSAGLGRPLRIVAPFRRMTKERVVRAAGALPWELTFSCLSPAGLKSCGLCSKCAERRQVLAGLAKSAGSC